MRNFGKYILSLLGLETRTHKGYVNVLRAILEQSTDVWIADMALEGSINQPNTMNVIITLSVNAATDSKEASKRSTRKKSKKGTGKGRGTNLSSNPAKSAKGGNTRLKSWKNTTKRK